ncbi:putative ABC transport system permease protein [Kibdelosporangium banguiense]|uniref:ABC transport system permease protein n=1 Tax=Kibdelosporangium banguiense TaxID=1365924 RepID=A0ABS4TEE9_9PSEU|nr:ABC transporter permease [Kibdelosporangium banguiense]MBP2322780.1 putative ABC transport system permease protein [Kibdelosporangium banguiense]
MTVVVGLVTGLVLAFVASATAFYVSASGSAATQYVVGHRCETDNGLRLDASKVDLPPSTDAEVKRIADRYGAQTYRTRIFVAKGPADWAYLITRDNAFDNVKVLAGGNRDGVWIPHTVAARLKVKPGDMIAIDRQPVLVGAVYERMTDPVSEYWCADRGQIVPKPVAGVNDPPAPFLVTSELLAKLGPKPSIGSHVDIVANRPLQTREQIDAWAADTAEMAPQLVAALNVKPAVTDYAALSAKSAAHTQETVREAVLPLTVISVLAGLLGVIGLASQWLQRRSAEVRLLWTRGVHPAAIGGKAVLEMGGPLLAGAIAGWAMAWLITPLLAPARQLDGWAPGSAAILAAITWLIGLTVLGVVTSMRVRREFSAIERAPRRIVVLAKKIPWEVLAGVAAIVVWTTSADHAIQIDPSNQLPTVSLAALAFPLLCIVFVVGVVARLAGLLSRASHRLKGWRNPTVLWALRRTAAQRKVAVALLAVAGLAIGVIAAGVGVAQTERESLADKTWMRVGSDHAIPLVRSAAEAEGVPAGLKGQATRIAFSQLVIKGNIGARILIVDPETFADGARWRDRWADKSLTDLMAVLNKPTTDGTIPVIIAGKYPLSEFISPGDYLSKMRVAGTVPSFPATGQYEGMIIASWRAVSPDIRRGFTQQILTRGDPAQAVAVLNANGDQTSEVVNASGATEQLPFLVVAWIFAFFIVLGFALAAVAVVTLLVSVETRRRSTAVAHALLARMGLRARALLVTHLVELAILAGTATVVGVGGGWLILELITQRLDPFPMLAPIPQPASLQGVGLLTLAVAISGVVLVAVYAVRAARRAKVRELLRA